MSSAPSTYASIDTKSVQLRAVNTFPCKVMCDKEFNSSFISLVNPIQDPRVSALYFSASGCVYQKYCYVFPITPGILFKCNYPYILLSNGTYEYTIEFEAKAHMISFMKLLTTKITELARNKITDKEIYDCFFNREASDRLCKGLAKVRTGYDYKSIFRLSGANVDDPIAIAMLLQQEKSFREYFDKSVHVVTWNIDQKKPPENVDLLFGELSKRYDIYVFCFQEIDMSMDAIMHGDSKEKKEAWDKALGAALTANVETYQYAGGIQLGTSYISVFVRDPNLISNVATATCTIGAMGFFNKTAVAVRFQYHDTNLCFICSHLSHGRKNVERRNSEFWIIQSELVFQTPVGEFGVDDHDAIWWSGDFNYRLTLPDPESREKFNETAYLLQHDQLILAHKQNKVFVGYNEAEIKFRPTYKFDKGTETLDTSSKQRGPAWCDRIFHRIPGPIQFIQQKSYNSIKGLLMSDHHPVAADFSMRVWQNDHDKAMKLYDEIKLKVDVLKWRTSLSQNFIDFKSVSLGEPKSQVIKLKNEGQIPVLFQVQTDACWITCHPQRATVIPDKDIELLISVNIDAASQVTDPVTTAQFVKCVKICYPSGKPPNFILLTAQFNLSPIGLPLEYLYRLPVELSRLPAELFIPRDSNDYQTAQIMNYPARVSECYELNALLDALKPVINDPQIFTKPGQSEEMSIIANNLKERKDIKGKFTQYGLFSVLFSIIECTKEPIFSYDLLKGWEQKDEKKEFMNLINSLPECNKTLFHMITGFFTEVLKKWKADGIQADVPTIIS